MTMNNLKPNMKNSIILLLLFTLLIPHEVISRISCTNIKNCLCIPGEDFEFQCPNEDFRINGGYLLHIDEKRHKSIEIDCIDKTKFDITELPEVNITSIDTLKIRMCPLPPKNFQEIIDWFSVKELNKIKFFNSDLENMTLTKEYFENLEQIKLLNLENNNLVFLEEDTFAYTPNLQSLDLNGNTIELNSNLFTTVPLLQSLYLSSNQIQNIPEGIFRNLSNLRILHLWNNNLRQLNETTFTDLINLRSLELSVNNIEEIHEAALSPLINLLQINLSRNNLTELSPNLFKHNTKLETILMKDNFNLILPNHLFANLTKLQYINLSNCKLQTLPERIFENLTNLHTLNLQNNQITSVSKTIFDSLLNLKVLDFQNNLLEIIEEDIFENLIRLEEVNLAFNRIKDIHYRTFNDKEGLKKVDLSHNQYSGRENARMHPVIFLNCHNAEYINLSYNFITDATDVISLLNKVHLNSLDLSHNHITSVPLIDLQSASRQLEINLSYNRITRVDFESVDQLAKQNMQNLDAYSIRRDQSYCTINIKENPISCDCNNYNLSRFIRDEMDSVIVKVLYNILIDNVTCEEPPNLKGLTFETVPPKLLICPMDQSCPNNCNCFWRPFDTSAIVDCSNSNLTNYPQLDLLGLNFNQTEVYFENNHFNHGPNSTLRGYDHVTKMSLAHNKIEWIDWLPPKLEVLHLDNNFIKRLPYRVLQSLNTSRLANLTLNNNPWICECEAENLTNFLRRHPKQVDAKSIFCSNTETTKLLIDLNQNDLCDQPDIIIFIIIPLLFLVLILFLIILYCTFKQQLKVWLYAKNLCLWWVTEEEIDKDKIYDAFISYSHKDEDFVRQNLLSVLESEPESYKLCLHYRDWTPGEFITKQIVNTVFESRRTIVVLSPNFLESVWGKMEFRTAHTQAMTEGRARVIIILYGDIDMNQLDNELKSYLKTNTYVKWGDPYFWNKLKYALPHSKKYIRQSNNSHYFNQKHANLMKCIDDKFSLVTTNRTQNTISTPSPGTTPPVLALDPSLLKSPLNFIPNSISASEKDTPPAEAGTLLMTQII